MKYRHILVTGANGFIGCHLCQRLLDEGFTVAAVSRSSAPERLEPFLDNQNFRVFTGDITNELFVRHLFQSNKFDLVFHLAIDWDSLDGAGNNIPSFQDTADYRANFQGTIHLLEEACRTGILGWIHSSTMSVYNFEKSEYIPVDENHPTAPCTPYGLSKLLAEEMCRYYGRKSGLDYMILRYSGVYGIGKDRGVVAGFAKHCLEGNKDPIVALADRTSDFVYVEDIVDANILATAKLEALRGRIFNIGSGNETSVSELAEMIRDLTGVKVEIKEETPPNPRRFYFDIQRAKVQLGYNPRSVQRGLAEYIEELIRLRGENIGNSNSFQ